MSEQDEKILNTDLITAVNSIKNSDTKTTETEEAIKAIEMASRMMDAIMAGRQLDLAFYSLFANSSVKRIRKVKKKAKK